MKPECSKPSTDVLEPEVVDQNAQDQRRPRMGRPPVDIDQDNLEKLLMFGHRMDEVLFFFNCARATMQRYIKINYPGDTFQTLRNRLRAGTNLRLRQKLYKKALEEENVHVLMFLAKHDLGMRDALELQSGNSKPEGFTFIRPSKQITSS